MIFSRQALLIAMAALSGSVNGFTPLSYNSASVRCLSCSPLPGKRYKRFYANQKIQSATSNIKRKDF